MPVAFTIGNVSVYVRVKLTLTFAEAMV